MRRRALFLFGKHGSEPSETDRTFFRQAVSFVEERVRAGRTIVLVEERVWKAPHEIVTEAHNPEVIDECRRRIKDEMIARNHIAEEFKRGVWNPSQFEWGFGQEIVHLNKRRPGTIKQYFEEPDPHIGLAALRKDRLLLEFHHAPKEEKFKLFVRFLTEIIDLISKRDKQVAIQMEKLRRMQREADFLLVRGYAHKQMVHLFDTSVWDVNIRASYGGVSAFTTDAILAGTSRMLSHQEVEEYAHLEFAYRTYLESFPRKFVSRILGWIGKGESEAQTKMRAREFALSHGPNWIKEEIGRHTEDSRCS